jgi:hypothetical protein
MTQQETTPTVNAARWATYSAAGIAALACGADTAEADITYVEVNQEWTTDDDVYFALEGPAALNFWHPAGGARVGVFNGGFYGEIVGFSANDFGYVSNLGSGVNVSAQPTVEGFATFAFNGGYTNSQFVDTSGFFGFQFDAGAGTQYGWGRLTAAGDSPVNTYTIVDYAYADVGESIATGQISAVPEPTSLGLLALGGLGVLANRRRKTSSAS